MNQICIGFPAKSLFFLKLALLLALFQMVKIGDNFMSPMAVEPMYYKAFDKNHVKRAAHR